MRLDKFLKVSRVIKRRSVANEACDIGRVKINDKQAKAFSEVKVGDIIEIKFGETWTKFEVLSLEQSIKKEEAENMVKILE
ncbi:MAG: RNA-binding S4 domain-containing protein [Clostridia bacterium]|nr:RNA-binding S4 domain-containing protein [Clostridia bacterium]